MNVIHVCTDDQGSGEEFDNPVMFPYLSTRPHGSWIKVNRAIVSVPLCTPSRAGLMTGQRYDRTGWPDNNPTDVAEAALEAKMIGPALQAAGYRTGHWGKYHNLYNDYHVPAGYDYWFAITEADGKDPQSARSWRAVTQGSSNAVPVFVDGDGTDASYLTDVIAGRVATAIGECATDDVPFYFYVPVHDPHHPPDPPARYSSGPIDIGPDPVDWNAKPTNAPGWMAAGPTMSSTDETTTRTDRRKARQAMKTIDDAVSTILDALETHDLLDSTIVMIHTDNSNAVGRKGFGTPYQSYQKRSPYLYASRTSMMVRFPGATSRDDDRLVSTLDIPATVLAQAGATPAVSQDGRDLTAFLLDEPVRWRTALEWGFEQTSAPSKKWRAVITDDNWRYADYYERAQVDVYDLTADPWETTNLPGDPKQAELSTILATLVADPHDESLLGPLGTSAGPVTAGSRHAASGGSVTRWVNVGGVATAATRRYA